jgi:hypothetical protein
VATFEQLAASNGVTEDASLRPAIPDARDFNLTYVKAEPGKGAALHSHLTVEVFRD